MSSAAKPCAAFLLSLRNRSVIAGNGGVTDERSIFCPRLQHSVGLAPCRECERFYGTSIGLDREFIYCADPAAAEAQAGAERRRSAPPTPADSAPVSTIMTADVVCVRPEVSVESLMALLLDRGFGGAPVVDEEGRPIGVVSKTDLIRDVRDVSDGGVPEARWITRNGRPHQLERGSHLEQLPRATVGDVMTPIAFALPETASISRAAALMVFEDIHRVPVVSEDGKVVGIVSSLDVLAWLARHDGYLVKSSHPHTADGSSAEGGSP